MRACGRSRITTRFCRSCSPPIGAWPTRSRPRRRQRSKLPASGIVHADSAGAAMRKTVPSIPRAILAALALAAALAAPVLAQPAITLTPLGTGGVVSAPLHVATPHDGTGRLFVVSPEGVIKIYQNGAYLATPSLDTSSLVTYSDERGTLSLDVH